MPTPPPQLPSPSGAPLALTLPQFRSPRPPVDQLDPDNTTLRPPTQPPAAPATQLGETAGDSEPGDDVEPQRELPALSPDDLGATRSHTSTRASGASAGELAPLLVGLAITLCGTVGWWLGQRGIEFRRPERRDLEDMAEPAARIITRHVTVPMHPDIADATQIVAAGNEYLLRGPVLYRAEEALPEGTNE